MKEHPDVIVIGGGVMGCSIALRLAEQGASVTVLERSVPGAEASSAAAGILGPCIEAAHGNHAQDNAPVATSLRLGLASRELYQSLSERCLGEGLNIGWRRCGVLRVALSQDEVEKLEQHQKLLDGHSLPSALLDRRAALELEPALSNTLFAALHLPQEAQLDPKALLPALHTLAQQQGALFHSGSTVEAIEEDGRKVKVNLNDKSLTASRVVVAAGSWTSLIPGLPLQKQSVRPIRGQIVSLKESSPSFSNVVFGAGGYVVTRKDGTVLVGSTEEDVGFDRNVSLAGMRDILRIASSLAPTLDKAEIRDFWSNFRPKTSDKLPLVGPTRFGSTEDSLFLASGHFRNGILLAQITAQIVAAQILQHEAPLASDEDLRSISPNRLRTPQ